jgi:folate-dependent phosphoribosylglycinamide formyltransferase PurN
MGDSVIMGDSLAVIDRPIRVIVFASGPILDREAAVFLSRLEVHPEIELAACFCQSQGQTFRDLWNNYSKRRGVLAVPLILNLWLGTAIHWISHPGRETQLSRTINSLKDRIFFVQNIHAPEVCQAVEDLRTDLGLIYGAPILKPVLFEVPVLGTLGIHHGTLPAYRGKKTTFWEIYHGEKTAGVTIQKVNAGLDTGEIVKQGQLVVGRHSYRWVFNQIIQLGYEVYIQAILEVKNGTAIYLPQNGVKKPLCKDPHPGDFFRLWLRWMQRIIKG